MTEPKQDDRKGGADKGGSGGGGRGDRLAAELRANLARRKAQARSRRQGNADERPEGLSTEAKSKKP
ncbi:hypothetical protein [Nitratireductor soli]|uniref:hypothetical protein n=1 Tax=Nitratireductor soli TaxID=1670619 RepID=UPI00065E321D|nr:hypothetical protein [Nitratireductor soli]